MSEGEVDDVAMCDKESWEEGEFIDIHRREQKSSREMWEAMETGRSPDVAYFYDSNNKDSIG